MSIFMNYVKKLNLHWFCTQNHILEPFSVRRACTKSYVTSEPYPRASQIWCQNVRETWKKKVIKCRGESFARCRVIARNVEGGPFRPPPVFLGLNKSPGGLNAHLNWRKLPLVHLGVCYQLEEAMEALPLVTFYIGPPPQPATPRRGHWGHPGNCHEQSLFFT